MARTLRSRTGSIAYCDVPHLSVGSQHESLPDEVERSMILFAESSLCTILLAELPYFLRQAVTSKEIPHRELNQNMLSYVIVAAASSVNSLLTAAWKCIPISDASATVCRYQQFSLLMDFPSS